MRSLAEADPVGRSDLLNGLIAEGEHDLACFAIEALREQPNESRDFPGQLNYQKVVHAHRLINTLSDQGLFEDANSVVGVLEAMDPNEARHAIIQLLENGYGGSDECYLRLDFEPEIRAAQLYGGQASPVVFRYMNALAAYGVNLLDQLSDHGRLFAEAMATVEEQRKKDYYLHGIGYLYASKGHIRHAVAIKELIQDPYWRSLTVINVARAAQDRGYSFAASSHLTEAYSLLQCIRDCSDACTGRSRSPEREVREIEINAANVLAKQDYLDEARALVGPVEPVFAYDQALVYTELYQRSGNQQFRLQALAALANNSVFDRESVAGEIIEAVAVADQKWNNVTPSLLADSEPVPLVAWELHGLYARKHRTEEHVNRDIAAMEDGLLEALGVNPLALLGEIALRKNLLRDHTLGVLAKLLAKTNAPTTALHLLSLIETPTERVRAMVAVGSRLAAETP